MSFHVIMTCLLGFASPLLLASPAPDSSAVFQVASRLGRDNTERVDQIEEVLRARLLADYVESIQVPVQQVLQTAPEVPSPRYQTRIPEALTLAEAFRRVEQARRQEQAVRGGNSDNIESTRLNREHWEKIIATMRMQLDQLVRSVGADEWETTGILSNYSEVEALLEGVSDITEALSRDAEVQRLRAQLAAQVADIQDTTASAGATLWAGTWHHSGPFGSKMVIQAAGNKITGNYDYKGGRIDGVLLPGGTTFIGRWYHTGDYDGEGTAKFVLSADANVLSGSWAYGTKPPTSGSWNYSRDD
ncbi:MAG: hypothetical protein AAGJ31_13930 [Verrucomicrobiota bacterium]